MNQNAGGFFPSLAHPFNPNVSMIKPIADMNVIINPVVRSNGSFIRREDIKITPETMTKNSPTTVSSFGFLFNPNTLSGSHLIITKWSKL